MKTSHAAYRWIVIGPFLIVLVLMAVVAVVSIDALSAARAVVGGESLYSKGQKDAVHHLLRYAQTHDMQDWARYERAITFPIGDRKGRLALDRPDPDVEAAFAGFIEGGNHPDDIPAVARIFRFARTLPHVVQILDTWRRGDELVAELEQIALEIRHSVEAGQIDGMSGRALMLRLTDLNSRLTDLAAHFSAQLGDAARWVQHTVLIAFASLSTVLAAFGMLWTSRLLKRQLEAEEALRETNQRWERAAAATEIGLFELDVPGGRMRLDPRAGSLFGLSLQTPVVLSVEALRQIVHPDDRARVDAGVARARSDGRQIELRFRAVAPESGAVRHVEIATRRSEHHPEHLHGLMWDVSAKVQAERLRLDKEAAERSSRAKTEFLSRVSHELRTPLNAVLGFAQLLAADDREPLTPTQSHRVAHVLSSGRHLLGLINDVLDLSNIDQATFPLARREVDPVALVHGVVQRVEPMARASSIEFALSLPEEAAIVIADPLRIEQILGNLLSNAIKYNRPNGRVYVRLEYDPSHWCFEVEDTGRGMSPSALQQLYQPFNRLGAEHSRVEGTGLGLVITRQLVQRMGGELEARSEPGVGSTFRVRLPRAPDEPASPDAERARTHDGSPSASPAPERPASLAANGS